MSHFTVLVIGPDYEAQLEPYDENKTVAPYREYLSEKEKAYYDECEVTFDREKKQWFRMSVYNPKSKWDWYQIGGRWRGYFRLKDEHKGMAEPGTPREMLR